MECSINDSSVIEWTLDPKHIEELYTNLYDNIEHGGEIVMDMNTKTSSKVIKSSAGKIDSVDAPDAIVNWHSHPINCYNNEETIWGWPSGEDMRETLVYGLRGSACHVVPSVEGTYTMQPNPCIVSGLFNIEKVVSSAEYPKLKKLNGSQNWGNFIRGLIIATIEIYFRSTHVFRSIDYMNKYRDISAHDFVEFANIFKIENIFNEHSVKECSKLGCNQIIKYENQRMTKIPFEKYVYDYESDTNIYYIDKNGNSSESKVKYINALKKGALGLLEDLIINSTCMIPIKDWHTSTVFCISLYDNKVLYQEKWHLYDKLNFEDKILFLKGRREQKDIVLNNRDIKFKLFDLKGNCNHDNIKTHMKTYENDVDKMPIVQKKSTKKRNRPMRKRNRSIGKRSKKRSSGKRTEKTNVLIIGSEECHYCIKANEMMRKKKKIYNFNYVFKKYSTIKKAIDEARKIKKEINTIPAIFLNNVYQPKFPF